MEGEEPEDFERRGTGGGAKRWSKGRGKRKTAGGVNRLLKYKLWTVFGIGDEYSRFMSNLC